MSTEKSNSLPNKKNKFVFLTTGKSLDIPPEKKLQRDLKVSNISGITGISGVTGIMGFTNQPNGFRGF